MEGRAVGDKLQADLFAKGDVVKVAGLSKARAFRAS